jgi:hypothetical protein
MDRAHAAGPSDFLQEEAARDDRPSPALIHVQSVPGSGIARRERLVGGPTYGARLERYRRGDDTSASPLLGFAPASLVALVVLAVGARSSGRRRTSRRSRARSSDGASPTSCTRAHASGVNYQLRPRESRATASTIMSNTDHGIWRSGPPAREVDWEEIEAALAPLFTLMARRVSRDVVAARAPSLLSRFGRDDVRQVLTNRFGMNAEAVDALADAPEEAPEDAPANEDLSATLARLAARSRTALRENLREERGRAPREAIPLGQLFRWEHGLVRELVDDRHWPLPRNTFAELATYGEGSRLCLWVREGAPVTWPVVLFGGEGELALVAPDARALRAIARRAWAYEDLEKGRGPAEPLVDEPDDDLRFDALVAEIEAARGALDAELARVCGVEGPARTRR